MTIERINNLFFSGLVGAGAVMLGAVALSFVDPLAINIAGWGVTVFALCFLGLLATADE